MNPGRNAPLTPDDVLWLINDGRPVKTAELQILVVTNTPPPNTGLKLGDVLLIDSRGDEYLALVKQKMLSGKFVRIQRQTRNLPANTHWTTTDPKAAWALGQKVKQAHAAGSHVWDGKSWNLVDLEVVKRRPDQAVVCLEQHP
ncbi:MAG TPA: hypothetical protein VE198_04875 [Actinoallomurus sp.]|nr:hypothetical protein [Actinoallomurus sp.]